MRCNDANVVDIKGK